MKKTAITLKVMLATALLWGAFTACQKKDLSITKSAYGSFSKWSNTMAPPKQKFTVNLTTGGTIVGDHGYRFYFAPGSLLDQAYQPVTGNVEIYLTEVTNVIEMLGSGARTEAYNGILGSAGMFNLTLTKNGKALYINPAKPVKATVMANSDVNMSGVTLFSGSKAIDSATGDSSIKWNQRDSLGTKFNWDSLNRIYDSINKVYLEKRCIRFDLNFSGWCNLDAYYNDPSGASIMIKAEGTKSNLETRVFMYLKQGYLTGLYELSKDYTDNELFTSTYYNLPIGWSIKIIVVTRTQDKELKYQVRDITNATSTVHSFSSLTPVSDSDLESFFRSLN